MVNRVQLYARTASGKGFLQYLRIPFRSPTHIRGVCSGASKVWISDYHYSGSDAEFWRKFNARIVDYDEIYGAQDDPRRNTLGMNWAMRDSSAIQRIHNSGSRISETA